MGKFIPARSMNWQKMKQPSAKDTLKVRYNTNITISLQAKTMFFCALVGSESSFRKIVWQYLCKPAAKHFTAARLLSTSEGLQLS
jgi:hypothetical protein